MVDVSSRRKALGKALLRTADLVDKVFAHIPKLLHREGPATALMEAYDVPGRGFETVLAFMSSHSAVGRIVVE